MFYARIDSLNRNQSKVPYIIRNNKDFAPDTSVQFQSNLSKHRNEQSFHGL